MLMGQSDTIPAFGSSKELLLSGRASEVDDDDITSEDMVYTASFEELSRNNVQYDTIIWVSISLLLVLAWGVGIVMLLYLPIRRCVLRKDITSRKLCVTPSKIVYKVSRPSFIPFWGVVKIEKHVPLSLVIDIIIEQGCLQSKYGIHTFRVESVAHGKASPVDELQFQGVSDPELLRKVIIAQASRVVQDAVTSWRPDAQTNQAEIMARMESLTEGADRLRSPAKSHKIRDSFFHASMEGRGLPGNLVLNKLEEVNRSVKKIELLIEKSHSSPRSN